MPKRKLPAHTHVGDTLRTPQLSPAQSQQPVITDLGFIEDLLFTGATGLGKFVDGFLTGAKIALLAITTGHIENLAITNAKIANLAVDAAKIANLAVTNAKIANLAVDSAKIADLAVLEAKIANLAVTNAKIADAAITNLKILSGTIEFSRCTSEFSKASLFQHNRWITSMEALTGYIVTTNGNGSVTCRKNYTKFDSGTSSGAYAQLNSYPTIDFSLKPEVKLKFVLTQASTPLDIMNIVFLGISTVTPSWNAIEFVVRHEGSGVFGLYGRSIKADAQNSIFLQNIAVGVTYILKFKHAGTTIEFYVNDVLQGTQSNASYIPTSGVADDIAVRVNAGSTSAGHQIIELYNYTAAEEWM